MARRHRNQLVTTAFHYLVKSLPNDDPDAPDDEDGFTQEEFDRIVDLLRDTSRLSDQDLQVVRAIKDGTEMHRHSFAEPHPGVFFGEYEGAYYGQRLRNNMLGDIDPESLNLRKFYYLVTRLRDGKILVGVTYHGQFGDYEGIRAYFSHHLRGNYRVASKTLKSIATELGDGHPISLKLTYRRAADRPERRSLFSTSGEIAVKRSEFGDDFEDRVAGAARQIRGTDAQRKRAIANLVNQGDMIELDADEIIGCSAVVTQNGRQRTVYFLGENNFSTKFYLPVNVRLHGDTDPQEVMNAMLEVMRERVLPLIHDAEEA